MVKRMVIMIIFVMLAMQNSYSWGSSLSEGSITIRVVDEDGKPFEGADVGLGFEKNTSKGTEKIPIKGTSNNNGIFTGSAKTINYVSYRVSKNGYYDSWGEYRFQGRNGGRWEPWNPEIKVILRKIENPVPMYARNTQMSPIEIPVVGKEIGFDLIEYDWVKPYGKGKHSDFIFKLEKHFVSEEEFEGKLTLIFSEKFDGIQLVREDREFGSKFKLPRIAPESNYQNKLFYSVKKMPGEGLKYNFKQENNYIFRVRSQVKNGKLIRAMYGKIHGDFRFDPRGGVKTSGIVFKYYLNPDFTRNLEFDPSQNLFRNLDITERVGLE